MAIPVTTLIENAAGVIVPPAGALTVDILKNPLPGKLIALSAEHANYAASEAFPGRQHVASLIDELDGTLYPPVNTPSFFDLSSSGTSAFESKVDHVNTARGYRLPVAKIQGKSAMTLGLVMRNTIAVRSASERIVGSTTNNSGQNEMLFVTRSASGNNLGVGGRLTTGTSAPAALIDEPPEGEWFGLLAYVDYSAGLSLRIESVRSNPSNDRDSGWLQGFTGPAGVSPTINGQGLAIGGTIGSSGTATAWDSVKFAGDIERFDLWPSLPSDTLFAGTTLSRRSLLKEHYRTLCNLLNP